MSPNLFHSPLDTCTPDALLSYYRTRNDVHYFPVLDKEQTTRDKIDRMLANHFTFNGESYYLSEGFDWTKNPSRDIEWQILLHKFYYAVGLGATYHETNDRRYAEKWIELTSSWIDR